MACVNILGIDIYFRGNKMNLMIHPETANPYENKFEYTDEEEKTILSTVLWRDYTDTNTRSAYSSSYLEPAPWIFPPRNPNIDEATNILQNLSSREKKIYMSSIIHQTVFPGFRDTIKPRNLKLGDYLVSEFVIGIRAGVPIDFVEKELSSLDFQDLPTWKSNSIRNRSGIYEWIEKFKTSDKDCTKLVERLESMLAQYRRSGRETITEVGPMAFKKRVKSRRKPMRKSARKSIKKRSVRKPRKSIRKRSVRKPRKSIRKKSKRKIRKRSVRKSRKSR